MNFDSAHDESIHFVNVFKWAQLRKEQSKSWIYDLIPDQLFAWYFVVPITNHIYSVKIIHDCAVGHSYFDLSKFGLCFAHIKFHIPSEQQQQQNATKLYQTNQKLYNERNKCEIFGMIIKYFSHVIHKSCTTNRWAFCRGKRFALESVGDNKQSHYNLLACKVMQHAMRTIATKSECKCDLTSHNLPFA